MTTPRESFTVRFLHREFDAHRLRLALFDAQQHAAADHQFGKFLDGRLRGLARRHHRALPHDRNRVGDRHDLAQLVGDQDDRLALVLQHFEDAEKVIGLGRRQHAGRLVEDQDFGAAIQRLEDFDALLQPNRKFLDHRVGLHLQPVFALQPLQFRARLCDRGVQQRFAFRAEDDVLDDGEILDQHEMLMDHADAGGDGVVRRPDRGRLSAHQDLAAVGMIEAVEDRHQRRLAGAILADNAVDGPALDLQIDVAVGANGTETLVDPYELNRGLGHAPAPPPFGLSFGHNQWHTIRHLQNGNGRYSRQILGRLSISNAVGQARPRFFH